VNARHTASKAAIDGFSLATRAEYASAGLDIGVTVLCPGLVRSGFVTSERLRRGAERADARAVVPREAYTDGAPMRAGAEAVGAIDPTRCGPIVLDANVHDQPYVLTHPVPEHVAVGAHLLGELAAGRGTAAAVAADARSRLSETPAPPSR
jgi:hypothetical protein